MSSHWNALEMSSHWMIQELLLECTDTTSSYWKAWTTEFLLVCTRISNKSTFHRFQNNVLLRHASRSNLAEEPRLVEETATYGRSKTHGETTTRNFTSYCTEELKHTQTHVITLETTTYATSRSNSHWERPPDEEAGERARPETDRSDRTSRSAGNGRVNVYIQPN